MKELTFDQIRITTNAYMSAQEHLSNAIKELRQMVTDINIVNAKEIRYFSPFGNRGGELNLSQISDKDLEIYRKNLEFGCWKMLIWRSGIMASATEDDRERTEKEIANGSFGAFTEENITKVLQKLKDNENSFIRNIVKEAFRYFSPDPRNKAPIRQKTVEKSGLYGSLSFSSAWTILGKALLLLDGKPVPENYGDSLAARMNDAVQKRQMEFECPYFRAKFYEKSLTVHLSFTRMDLINIINEIGRTA